MASEYKKQGGGYTTDKETGQDESQKNLSKWGDEDWQTKDGSGTAKHEDGTRERYLPRKAWDQMNDEEKEETDQKKQDASATGQQHVANTGKAKQARSNANKGTAEKDEGKTAEQAKTKDSKQSSQKKAKDGKQTDGSAPRRSGRGAKQDADDKTKAAAKEQADEESAGEAKDGADEEFEDPGADDAAPEQQKAGQKRGRQTKKEDDDSNKKQKANDDAATGKNNGTFGSKHDSTDEPAPVASADRLPQKGQRVSWKALPGWVHGETVEVLTKEKTVDGKKVKASEKDPRIVMKSDNGKIAVHKPAAVYF